MSDEVKTCKDCKHFIADGSSRRGLCELKKSRIDKWGQEVSIRRMASGKACKKAEPAASQSVDDAPLREIETYKQEYRLAAAANRQLADALDKARELMIAQGFPPDYIIDIESYIGKNYSKAKQIARLGNAVCPPVAAALVRANCAEIASQRIINTMAMLNAVIGESVQVGRR